MEYKFNGPDGIEKKWQDYWREKKVYKISNDSAKPKCYVLDMFPYPSGAGLHVGHPLGYIASDIYSRYKRLKGFNVLHPMGFDSFGLPAEQYAIETGQHPADTTEKNIATFKSQLDKIGFCYDWEREVRTSDPSFYKWTQWIFLQLFNSYFCNTQKKALPISLLIKKYETKGALPLSGLPIPGTHFTADEWNGFTKKQQEDILMKRRLAFCAYGEVNWCEALGTVLANDEVVNGVSERGGHPVEKKKMRQWYLRITAYADRLLEGLETVQFSESMKEMQRNWIGKSEGAEILIPFPSPRVEKDDWENEAETSSPSLLHRVEKGVAKNEAHRDLSESQPIKEQLEHNEFSHPSPLSGEGPGVRVYTTRPDTIFGVDFIVLAPEHEFVTQITTTDKKEEIEKYLHYVKSRSDRERQAEVKQITGCFTGAYAINPFNAKQIPIYIAEYVLAGYGTGAIMAVPCGDQRDFAFAKHFNIPITNIIGSHFNGEEANPTKDAVLENSGFLNGLLMKDAIAVANNKIEELGIGKRKINYRMRDAGFSRQRYWGEPFPIIWSDGIAIPLDAEELPLELPFVEKYGPGPNGEGPLANITSWVSLTESYVDLTPNPSPKERGRQDPASYGYINSTVDEWKNTSVFAKQNRKEPTEEENIIWQELRNRQLDGFKFRRQHPIAGFIPDFVCLEKKLIIEIDGGYHNEEEQEKFDGAREEWLKENGFEMIRFSNNEVNNYLPAVLKKISEELSKNIDVANAAGTNPPLLRRGVGGEVRETSTMPGYAGSSWYFLRYMDPHNNQTFCDRKASDYWNQVDLYIGGTEHAVGHLLYSRMWTKFLFDLGLISFDEPYKKLVNQGMIQGSSRFVYKLVDLDLEDSNWPLVNYNVPPIFISKEKYFESVENSLKKDFDKNSKWLEFILKVINQYSDEKLTSDMIQGLKIVPIHVNVNFVHGFELKIEQFKKWREEFANAEFFLEDNGRYICGVETEKMSKRYYNTVDPADLCDSYGADTFRMYEMFLGPVEASKPWDTKGIEGVHRFLRKLWRLFNDDVKGPIWTTIAPSPLERAGGEVTAEELKILHRSIKKIEEDTEKFSFNTAVSAFMICINELADIKCHKKEILEKILILLVPYAPHIAEELWHQLGNEGTILDAQYPEYDAALLIESTKEYPVSINGKVRTNINLALDLQQSDVEKIIKENEVVQKWLEGKEPQKIIYVKNKMINVVIK